MAAAVDLAPTAVLATPGQSRLWLLDELSGPSGTYNVNISLDLAGAIDTERLKAAVSELCRAHPPLRTRLVEVGGRVVQHVEVGGWPELESAEVAPDRLETELEERLATPFRLASEAPFRASLLWTGVDRATLQFVVHHSVVDGVSVDRLLADLERFHNGAVAGDAEAAEADGALRRYLAWRAQYDASPERELDEAYWRERLAGAERLLEDVVPFARSAARGRGSTLRTTLPAESWRRAVAVGRKLECTEHVLFATAAAVALSRCTGRRDLLIGVPFSERFVAGLDAAVGFFVNTLPLRIELDPASSVRDAALTVRAEVVRAIEHGRLAYESIVTAAAVERTGHNDPLLDVFVGYEPQPYTPRLNGVIAAHRAVANRSVPKFPIVLLASAGDDGAAVVAESDRDVVGDLAATSLTESLESVLACVADGGTARLRELDVISPASRRRLLADRNRPTVAPPVTVNAVVVPAVRRGGAAVAVEAGEETLTYADLDRASAAIAAGLSAAGAGPDAVIGIHLERGPYLPAALLGVLRSGGAYLPFDLTHPPSRMRAIAEVARPTAILVDGEIPPHLSDFETLPVGGLLASDGDSWVDPPVAPDDLAYVLFTSGSTGVPKGVAMPHSVLANLLRWQANRSACGPRDATLNFASIAFDVSFQEIFATFSTGGRLVVASREETRDPLLLADLIRAKRVRRIFMPFVALEEVLRELSRGGPAALSEVITAGEQLRISPAVKTARQRLGFALENHYGPTETHVATAHLIQPEDDPPEFPPIGRPIDNVRVYVLDADGNLVPPGWPGEISIGGAAVARGYLSRDDLTAERFLPDLFAPGGRRYRTGDRARWLDDGSIQFLGRTDDQVKVSGYRVELGEVEHHLLRCDGVRQAAVVAATRAGMRELVAFVVGDAAADLGAASLRAALADALPEYMRPHRLVFVKALPRTVSGKIDRQALRARAEEEAETREPRLASVAEAPDAPGRELHERLHELFTKVFPVPPEDVRQTWFELGGTSLTAAWLASEVRARLRRDVRVSHVFRAPSIAQLAQLLPTLPELAEGEADLPPSAAEPSDSGLPLLANQERILRTRWTEGRGGERRLEFLSTPFLLPLQIYAAARPLAEDVLAAALSDLGERHEALRTVFTWPAGKPPAQLLAAAATATLQTVDLRHARARADDEERCREALDGFAARPFALNAPNRVRALQLVRRDGSAMVAFAFDHLVCDHFGAEAALEDLAALYAARTGAPAAPPAAPPSYVEYVRAEDKLLCSPRAREELEWWRGQLGTLGAAPVLEIAGWPNEHGVEAARHRSHPSPRKLAAAVRTVASAFAVTPFVVAVCAAQQALHETLGSSAGIAAAYANRDDARWASLVGYLAHPVVVPPRPQDTGPLEEHLRALAAWLDVARPHFRLPYQFMLAQLAEEAYRSQRTRPWLFLNMLPARRALAFGGELLEPVEVPEALALRQSVALTLRLDGEGDDGELTLSHPASVAENAWISQFFDAFTGAIGTLAASCRSGDSEAGGAPDGR